MRVFVRTDDAFARVPRDFNVGQFARGNGALYAYANFAAAALVRRRRPAAIPPLYSIDTEIGIFASATRPRLQGEGGRGIRYRRLSISANKRLGVKTRHLREGRNAAARVFTKKPRERSAQLSRSRMRLEILRICPMYPSLACCPLSSSPSSPPIFFPSGPLYLIRLLYYLLSIRGRFAARLLSSFLLHLRIAVSSSSFTLDIHCTYSL